MNSHITIPKSVLLRFADSKSGKISFYDFDTKKIRFTPADSYNTEIDYFPREFESFLCSDVETIIGLLNEAPDYLDDTGKIKKPILADWDKVKNHLIRIIAVQILRLPDTLNKLTSEAAVKAYIEDIKLEALKNGYFDERFINSANQQLHKYPTKEDQKKWLYKANRIEELTSKLKKVLINHIATFATIGDECEYTLAIPPTLYCECGKVYVFPFSPNKAFLLLPKKNKNETKYDANNNIITKPIFEFSDEYLLSLVPGYIKACKSVSSMKHLIAPKPFLEKLKNDGLLN
jgi:hypothetical protein